MLLLAALVPAGAAASPARGARAGGGGRLAAPATLPGSPGAPQAPTVVYGEDFEFGQGNVPIRLTGYAGATGETYTAAQAWLQNCNGWIASFQDPPGSNAAVKTQVADCTPAKGGPGAAGDTAWNNVRTLAQALGVLNSPPNTSSNHAVSAYTNGPVNNGDPGAGKVELQTVQPIPVTGSGRFLTFALNVAETSCTANKNHALLDYFLVNGTTSIPVTSAPIDPCTAGGHTIQTGVIGGTYTGDTPVLFTGTSLGVKIINEQGSGNGNDHAFDQLNVLDVTPQLDKSFSPATAQVGGTSTVTFTITNTSDLLAKSGWSFTDTLPAGLTLASPSAATTDCAGTLTAPNGGGAVSIANGGLAAGQPSCTATVKVTSATAGTYTNDASDITASTGLNPPGGSTVTFTNTPTIGLVKSVSPTWFSAAGQTLNYSFLVTNTSTVTLTGVAVTDTDLPGLSAITCPVTTLAASASTTCTATYVTTAADLAARKVNNIATASGTPPAGPAVTSGPAAASVPALIPPSITLVKSATPGLYSAAGQLINYDYLVTNTSPVTLSAIAVNDTLAGLTPVICQDTTLAAGASTTCTATYDTTAADLDAGSITNTATAQGDPPGSTTPVISDPSTVTVPAVQRPAIIILKSAQPTTFAKAGQVITYSYLVTNTGNVTLTGIAVNDNLPGLTGLSCLSDTLPAGITETCTATYLTTAADLAAGQVTNTATATGTPPVGPTVTSGPSTTTITVATAPAITIDKSASPGTFAAAGQAITYSYLVTNTGNVTLTGIAVNDNLPGLTNIICPDATLAIGGFETCTAAYLTTAADLAAGQVTNTATATGTPPAGPAVDSGPSAAIVPATKEPAITIVKSATPAAFAAAGQTISYSYLVTNAGNTALAGIAVNDDLPGLTGLSCPDATLAIGGFETCTAAYLTTTADVAAGSIINTATAQGLPPNTADPVISGPSTVIVPVANAPAITVLKTAAPGTFDAARQTISYSYLVTNSGNVPLTGIAVNDNLPGLSPVTCPPITLGIGKSETCTASYVTTAADLDTGLVANTATAAGTPPAGPPVTSDPSTAVVPAVQQPAITILKSAQPATFAKAGQAITYRYLVTNTGNVTLTGVAVNDDLPGLSNIICPDATLAIGGFETCTAIYATTAADLAAGQVTNTATATGTPPSGPAVNSGPSDATITVATAPAITIVKSATPAAFAAAGQTISYSYLVTNAGNVTLAGITVNDNLPGLTGLSCPASTLAIGGFETCTATYLTTTADLAAGQVTNTATATGTPPAGPAADSGRSTVTVPVANAPAITVLKAAAPGTFDAAGQTISYSYLVTNAGNVPLTGIAVNDNLPGLSPVTCPVTTLAVGASTTCTASYVTTAADLDAGLVANTATAQGDPPGSTTPVISDPSTTVVPAVEKPAITVVKSATPATYAAVGQVISYRFLVTNTGNVTLTHVNVTDRLKGLSAIGCPTATLAEGQSETCTASYRITAADLNAGHLTNTAIADGDPPRETTPAMSPPSTATDTAVERPGITVTKTAAPTSFAEPGQVVRYSFRVTNAGNVTLTHVHVTDTLKGLSAIDCPQATLAEGRSQTCTATYRITAADLTAGHVTNTATAHGDPPAPGTPVVSPPSAVTIKVVPFIPVTG